MDPQTISYVYVYFEHLVKRGFVFRFYSTFTSKGECKNLKKLRKLNLKFWLHRGWFINNFDALFQFIEANFGEF